MSSGFTGSSTRATKSFEREIETRMYGVKKNENYKGKEIIVLEEDGDFYARVDEFGTGEVYRSASEAVNDCKRKIDSKQLKRLDVFTDDFSPPETAEAFPGGNFKKQPQRNKPHDDISQSEDNSRNHSKFRPMHNPGPDSQGKQEDLDALDIAQHIEESFIKPKSEQFPGKPKMKHSEMSGDSFSKEVEKRMKQLGYEDSSKEKLKHLYSEFRYKGMTIYFTQYSDGDWEAYVHQSYIPNAPHFTGASKDEVLAKAKKAVDQYIAQHKMSSEKPSEENEKKMKKLAHDPVFPSTEKALAELKSECQAACSKIARKYGATPLAASVDEGRSEVSVSVGMYWK